MYPPMNFRLGADMSGSDPRKRFFKNIFPTDDLGSPDSNPFDKFSQQGADPNADKGFESSDGGANPRGTSSNTSNPSNPSNFMDLYKELSAQQNGPAMQAYRKYVDAGLPNRDDPSVRPGKLSKLAAILSGAATSWNSGPAAGMEVSRNILDDKYNERMKNYDKEGGRLREAAGLEENQNKNTTAAVKAVGDMQDKAADNKRQQAIADANIALAAARAKSAGQIVVHAKDGHVYVFDADKNKTDLGVLSETPEEKTKQAIEQATGIATATSPIIEGRQSRLAAKQSALTEGREGRIGAVKFGQEKEMEKIRQTDRIALTDERATNAAKNAAAKAKIPPSNANRIKGNLEAVDALVATDPVYTDLYDRSTGTITTKPTDPASLVAWQKLYDTLYAGTDAVKGTKGGNSFVRNPK